MKNPRKFQHLETFGKIYEKKWANAAKFHNFENLKKYERNFKILKSMTKLFKIRENFKIRKFFINTGKFYNFEKYGKTSTF